MDTKIKALILLLFSAFTTFAQTPGINFAAKFNITSATGGDPYNITGIVLDDLSRFTGSDVQVNDSIYVIDGDQLYVLAVTSITSVVGPTVTLVANDPNNAGVSIPTGQAAICRPTDNYKLPLYISGLRDDLRSMVMNRQAQLIDDINGSAVSAITDFTSAGVNVPPSPAASLNGGETWRNMTTGELWGSDGNVWYPYTRGPKECQDTVLVSAITVQSGGSVTTGSPLVRNTSGVWQHMYNHPSGTNLVPDGVVTDIIVGGRAIIQYCGVRKGSGATPNTSYYVDQSISTGFTTTKPTTNIRPLGKVASNGDFLINAGLLFSRDNSQALPTNEVGFGNSTGTAITSDTTLHFFPTSDKLRVSSPSNKGYVDINKGITINPDTLLTSQTFLKVNAARSSPYTYAPFGFVVDYGPQSGPYLDYVWTFGPNAAGNSGVSFEPTKPMASINWETSWLDGGVPTFEWHEHWKQPDSAAIRLSSYTIRYANATDPTRKTSIDLYQTADTWSIKSGVNAFGNPQYLYANMNRTTQLASFGLRMNPTNSINISGIGATAYFSIAGPGTKILDFSQNDGFVFNSLTAGYTKSTNTLQAGIVGSTSGNLFTATNLQMPASGNGQILMGSQKWITCGPSQTNFFAGYASGPATYNASQTGNVGLGYASLQSLSSNTSEVIAIGTFSGRYLTGSHSIQIGPYSRGLSTFAAATKYIAIGDSVLFNPSIDPTNKLVIENSPSNTPLLSGDFRLNRIGINSLNYSPNYTFEINSLLANTSALYKLQTTTDSVKYFVTSVNPNSVITGRVGDIANGSNGTTYIKKSGNNTNTGWEALMSTSGTSTSVATLMREESFTATAAQTAFTIAYTAPAVSGTSVPIRVYRNGVRLFYVASGPTITQFTYSGTTVTTLANTAGDIITIEYLN